MKKLTKILFIISILNLLTLTIYAQIDRYGIESLTNSSEFIIEGKVTDQVSFYGSDGSIYTEHTITVQKFLKGNLSSKNISIISLGGIVNGKREQWTHNLELSIGDTGSFFLNSLDKKADFRTKHKGFVVYMGAYGFFRYYNDNNISVVKSIATQQVGLLSFYRNIGLQVSTKQISDEFFRLNSPDDCINYRLEPIFGDDNSSKSTNIQLNIYVSIENGDYRLNNSEFGIKYNTNWFGENIVSNSKISAQIGNDFQSGYILSLQDFSNDVLTINIVPNDGNYSSREIVNRNEKLIASISVSILGFSNESPIDDSYSHQSTNSYLQSDGTESNFNCTTIEYTREGCNPVIDSISLIAAAGVDISAATGTNGKLTIHGKNLIRSNVNPNSAVCVLPDLQHRVRFKTVQGDWLAALEGDYISWSDTRIDVKVPTTGYYGDTLRLVVMSSNKVAAEGVVQVCIQDTLQQICYCNDISSDSLKVPFTAKNKYYSAPDEQNCPLNHTQGYFQSLNMKGGMSFYFSPDFDSVFVSAFRRAMNTWRCETGVNLIIDTIYNPENDIRISYGTSVDSLGLAAYTLTGQDNCSIEPDSAKRIIVAPNMIFDSTLTWINGIPDTITEYDIETVALHEIGHVIGLGHTLDTNHVMYVGGHAYLRTLSNDDIDGGKHIALLGLNETACTYAMQLVSATDCMTNILNFPRGDYNLKLFPNPVSSTLQFSIDDNLYHKKLNVRVYDILGNELLSSRITNKSDNRLNVSGLVPGCYFLIVDTAIGQLIGSSKFIKI